MVARHVVVVGGGNAGFAAALAAADAGARVTVLEKAPPEWAGGNSFFTAAAFRAAIPDFATARELAHEVDEERASRTTMPPYPADAFIDDVRRLSRQRCDPELTETLAADSLDVLRWLKSKGHRFELLYHRQAFEVDGSWHFNGGMYLGGVGEGPELVRRYIELAEHAGIDVVYRARVLAVEQTEGRGFKVTYTVPEGRATVAVDAVVLASGGFQADPQMRAQYLGPNWDLARVRGTPHNTGDGHRIALGLGAQPYGHWSGCHNVAWEAGAPAGHGVREARHLLTKQSYPLGIMVNADGKRFLDEGADLRAYTYARIGAAILQQPGGIAWQVFDQQTTPLLRATEYEREDAGAVHASSLRELAERAQLPPETLIEMVERFNDATLPGNFDPSVKDGLSTVGIDPPKSNWAKPLVEPPFAAYPVTCGVTFTYGGIRVDTDARVIGGDGAAIPGLYAAGELVGGIFYFNYPGGSGLTAGAVFGRRAGVGAAGSGL